jgi:endoglucanase
MRNTSLVMSWTLRASMLAVVRLASSPGMEGVVWAQGRDAVVVPAGEPRANAALVGATLFVSPSSSARREAKKWRRSRPDDAALMQHLAEQPVATWFGEWSGNVRSAVRRTVAAAKVADRVPVLVAYNLPHRDCGGHSSGGARSPGAYRSWIRKLTDGLVGASGVVVVLEPDALAGMECLSQEAREMREQLIRDAIGVLKAAGAVVYVDAGNARWQRADTMAARLTRVGIADADGFALNVSNFVATDVSIAYGDAISRLAGGRHYVIDTSRNGMGGTADGQWCNPTGQALGDAPTTRTGHGLADAFLWIKVPGESDGRCNGGPRAGAWWSRYALGLARERQQLAVPPEGVTALSLISAAVDRAAAAALEQPLPAR